MKLKTIFHKLVKYFRNIRWKLYIYPSISVIIRNELLWLFNRKECILIDGYLVNFYHKPPKLQNWGDDLNVYLLEKMTNKKIIPIKTLLFSNFLIRYSVIGSIIPMYITDRTIVWGSGVMNLNQPLHSRPKKVLAVRGPLTRNYLLKHNVDCPEIFGDPALLLPIYYKPKCSNKTNHKIGLIPHHRDYDNEFSYDELSLNDNIVLIDIAHYGNSLFNIVDEICSCEIILSSSLHGLIVADAYGVKNYFVEFTYHHPNYDKYKDYFLSVERSFEEPMSINKALQEADYLRKKTRGNINFDVDKLLSSCPFLN